MTASEILKTLGVPFDLIHMQDRPYVEHLLNVHEVLGVWGEPATVRLGGLLHSVYGTERFQSWKLDHTLHRGRVRELVGEDAETIAYANCALSRKEFDCFSPFEKRVFKGRFGGPVDLSDSKLFRSVCVVQLCDWLDQVILTKEWDYRLLTYTWIANHLGGPPLEAFNFVYRNYLSNGSKK